MARSFLTPINLNKLELQNAAIQNLTATTIDGITSPSKGQIAYDTTSNRLRVHNGTSFVSIPFSGTIVNADIATGAAIGYAKLSLGGSILNSDLAGSITNDKLSTNPLARANHTGTQLAATISDFDTQVRLSRLDQFAAPTAPVALNAQKITGLADPTTAQDAATKNYVDNAVVGIDWKPAVRAISTGNITLSAPQTIDGVAVVAGDRVLVAGQSTGSQNGIYLVAAGSWTRTTDCANGSSQNAFAVFVEEGTANADTGWVCTNNGAITIGTTALTFTQFSSAGAITAGNGLTKSGNTLHVGDGSSYAVGDILYASSGTALSKLAAVATGNVLISGGVTTAPSYGKVGLTTHVSGTLPVANGGTGSASTPGNGQLLIGNGSGYAVAAITQGTGVTVTNGAGTISLAIGQAVATTSTPQFAGLGLGTTSPAAGLTISGGKATFAAPAAGYASLLLTPAALDPSTLAIGDLWVNGTALKFATTTAAGGIKTIAFTDSNINGTATNVTGTVAAANGGTGNTVSPTNTYIAVGDGTKYVPTAPATVRSTIGATTKVTATLGAVTANTAYPVTHNLGTQDVIVQVRDIVGTNISGVAQSVVDCDIVNTDTNTVNLTFASSYAANSFRVTVIG